MQSKPNQTKAKQRKANQRNKTKQSKQSNAKQRRAKQSRAFAFSIAFIIAFCNKNNSLYGSRWVRDTFFVKCTFLRRHRSCNRTLITPPRPNSPRTDPGPGPSGPRSWTLGPEPWPWAMGRRAPGPKPRALGPPIPFPPPRNVQRRMQQKRVR